MKGLALFLAASVLGSPRDDWLRVASPHFEVYTNAGERAGRLVLARFEQIRGVLENTAPAERQTPLPVRIFVFATEADFRPFRPNASTQGFYQSGAQRDFIAMQYNGPQLGRVVFHEYVHLVLYHSSLLAPRWLEEGIAEFYSTLETQAGAARIGRPIEGHLEKLKRAGWLTAAQLTSVNRDSPYYNERGKVGIFYAQSWALAHMLHLAPGYRENLQRYTALFAQNPEGAFEQAFGKSLDAALDDLRSYLRGSLPTIEIAAPAGEPDPTTAVRPLAAAEAAVARAELLVYLGRREEAARLYQRVARENPSSPAAATGLGALALHQRRTEEARAHFERAIALGATDAATYFEYAMLLRETGAPRERVDEFLHKTVTADPNFAEAHFLIGVRATDDGRHAEAIEHLRAATRVLPRQSSFWHALAYAHYKLDQREEAQQAARRAARTASTPQETEMAAAIENLLRPETATAPKRAAVNTPAAWQNPQGDARLEGVLTEVDCRGPTARLRIEAGERKLMLTVKDPRAVVLKNTSGVSFEFACGAQAARRVVVEYKSGSGEVTAIEFR